MNVPSVLMAGGRWRFFPVPLGWSSFQALHNSCCRKKSTASKKSIPDVASCDKTTKESGKALDKLFSSEQQASILHVLNTASNNELEAFKLLRGRKSLNLVEHRKKFGPFQNLESLMNVPLFQYKTTVQICNSILCPETEVKKKKSQENRLLKKLLKPEIERERLKVYIPFFIHVDYTV
ncbi:transcription elongation factor, mitochondrial-like [Myotis lucifugus]|uniref:transcription elongation factor, mitochondrial-like n=1 Tax=Myotis lucifugus TaxID=59463 RepID=UPI0003C43391|nr:transcription elongation factor, mitochondrial-like [Myotis lucifugus]